MAAHATRQAAEGHIRSQEDVLRQVLGTNRDPDDLARARIKGGKVSRNGSRGS